MEITNSTRALVSQGIREKGIKPIDLAKKIGVDRSWMTRFFKKEGGTKSLSDDLRWKIEQALDIRFLTVVDTEKPISALAKKIDDAMEKDPRISESLSLLLLALEDDHYYDLPFIPTKDLVDFGKEIVRASHEDPDKPGKVGKLAMNWLSKRLEKLKNQGGGK